MGFSEYVQNVVVNWRGRKGVNQLGRLKYGRRDGVCVGAWEITSPGRKNIRESSDRIKGIDEDEENRDVETAKGRDISEEREFYETEVLQCRKKIIQCGGPQ